MEMRLQVGGLWRHPDFLKLWVGQTVSMFGSQITPLALPLLAALTMGARPMQMAGLLASQYAPATIVGLFAGAWVDRLRRPILIAADLARAGLLLSLPAAAALGLLRLELLYGVTILTSMCGVFFGAAYGAFLPSVAEREYLIEGNSKLEMSGSVARVAGPGLAGALVQLLTAPVAVAIDAFRHRPPSRRAGPHHRPVARYRRWWWAALQETRT